MRNEAQLKYQGYQAEMGFEEYLNELSKKDKKSIETIYWKPEIETDENGRANPRRRQNPTAGLRFALTLYQEGQEGLIKRVEDPATGNVDYFRTPMAVELEPISGKPTARAFQAFLDAYDKGCLIRTTGDIIALSPPLIIDKAQIDQLIGTLGDVLKALD